MTVPKDTPALLSAPRTVGLVQHSALLRSVRSRRSSLVYAPLAIRFDPLGALGWWTWHRKIEDRERLPVASACADRDDLLARVQVDALDRDRHSEHGRLEGHGKVLVNHRKPARGLL